MFICIFSSVGHFVQKNRAAFVILKGDIIGSNSVKVF